MKELYDIKNWKRTHIKSFDAWICMPELGIQIHNSSTGLVETVDNNNRLVICYPNGFMRVTTMNFIRNNFVEPHECSSSIGEQAVIKRLTHGIMPWHKVWSVGHREVLAIHIPYKGDNINLRLGNNIVNTQGIEHGDGDYIVCPINADGTPDLNRATIVNGLLFPHIFALNGIKLSPRMKYYLKSSKIEKPNCGIAPSELTRNNGEYLEMNGIYIRGVNNYFRCKMNKIKNR